MIKCKQEPNFTNVIMISFNDFQKVDIRVGKVINVESFPEARSLHSN